MSLPVEFHPAVQPEVDDGYRWYEQRQAGLGTDFLDAVERVIGEVAANPAADGDVREGGLTRFPYAVYYRVLPDRVRVLAAFHSPRDPSPWQSRT